MDGDIDDLYLNFNVLNNEVFEIGSARGSRKSSSKK